MGFFIYGMIKNISDFVIDKYKQWYYKAQEARIFANTNAEVMNFSDAEIMKKLEDNTFNSTNK